MATAGQSPWPCDDLNEAFRVNIMRRSLMEVYRTENTPMMIPWLKVHGFRQLTG